jgi:hypothetical protein
VRGEDAVRESEWLNRAYIPLGRVPSLDDSAINILEVVESLPEEDGKVARDSSWFLSMGT